MERYRGPHTIAESNSGATQRLAGALMLSLSDPEKNPKVAERDPSTRALYEAVLQYPEDSALGRLTELMATVRFGKSEDVNASEVVGALRGSIVTFMINVFPGFNDARARSAADWTPHLDFINEIIDSDEPSFSGIVGQFHNDMLWRNVSTTLISRYTPAELFLQTMRERIPPNARVLDLGSSIGLGMFALTQKDRFAEWFKFKSVKEDRIRQGQRRKLDHTEKANALVQLPSFIGQAVCVDTQPMYIQRNEMFEPGSREWAFGSMRSSERNNPRIRALFKTAVGYDAEAVGPQTNAPVPVMESMYRPPNVTFWTGDLTDPAQNQQFRELYPEPFDVVFCKTMLHQNAMPKRLAIVDTALNLLSEKGILLVGDFLELSRSSAHGPVPLNSIRSVDFWFDKGGRYRDIYVDKALPAIGWQQLSVYPDNSRNEIMVLTRRNRLEMNGEQYPFTDILRHTALL